MAPWFVNVGVLALISLAVPPAWRLRPAAVRCPSRRSSGPRPCRGPRPIARRRGWSCGLKRRRAPRRLPRCSSAASRPARRGRQARPSDVAPATSAGSSRPAGRRHGGCREGRASRPHTQPLSVLMKTLVVFLHLRWNFVFQRPRHLLTGLAAHYRVLFIEEPVHDDGAPRLESRTAAPGVSISGRTRPRRRRASTTTSSRCSSRCSPTIFPAQRDRATTSVWFYTPMALPLLSDLHPRAVVYDCMDELSRVQERAARSCGSARPRC